MDIPYQFFPDFLRGWIDGDGSIFSYTDHYMSYKEKHYTYQRLYVRLVSVSKRHLQWIQQTVYRLLGISEALSEQSTYRKIDLVYGEEDTAKRIR